MKSNLCLVIEKNRYMKYFKTHHFECLSPLEVSSCVILSMQYTYPEPSALDVFVISDQVNQLTPADIQSFESIEYALSNVNFVGKLLLGSLFIF